MEIRVYGMPGPQGSKKFVGVAKSGRGILVESSGKVKLWRQDVKAAAMEVLENDSLSIERHCNGAIPGAVEVEMIFTMPKPKSAPKNRRTWPSTRPDLSKIVRSTEDALTEAGVWEDDARVVRCVSQKVFPGEHPDALHIPGAVIRILPVVA